MSTNKKWLICAVFGHKYIIERVMNYGARKVGCTRCGKQWAMHDSTHSFVPWDLEFETMYAPGGVLTEASSYTPLQQLDLSLKMTEVVMKKNSVFDDYVMNIDDDEKIIIINSYDFNNTDIPVEGMNHVLAFMYEIGIPEKATSLDYHLTLKELACSCHRYFSTAYLMTNSA